MPEIFTKFIRYLYLDVVDFTLKRSVEAQTEVVDSLNNLVRKAQSSLPLAPERVIYLPTGDGIGIAILDEQASYDIHMLFALEIIRLVHEFSSSIEDTMRKYEVRIGLSQNSDNLVTDINGSKNVAGHGINTAQRVMSVADGSQILVSQSVYDTLSFRERYMKHFRQYRATIKHGIVIVVYQYTDETRLGLSVVEPSQFMKAVPEERKLTLHQAYYVGHAISNRAFILSNLGDGQNVWALAVLLYFLAEDSIEVRTTSKYDRRSIHIYGKGTATSDQVLRYYLSVDFWVCARLADHSNESLSDCATLFDRPYIITNEKARIKLQKDYPDIIGELSLENA